MPVYEIIYASICLLVFLGAILWAKRPDATRMQREDAGFNAFMLTLMWPVVLAGIVLYYAWRGFDGGMDRIAEKVFHR